MAYQPNSIGRTMAGELFMTDDQSVAHLEGTPEFDVQWKMFLTKKRDVIRSLSPLMTASQKYNIIYPTNRTSHESHTTDYMQQAVNEFVSIWCGCLNKAGMEL